MGVLEFDGVNDSLKWSTLAATLANVGDGPWTLAVLLKRGGTGIWGGVSYLLSGTGSGTAEAGMSFRGTADPNELTTDVGGGGNSTSAFASTTSPYLFVLSKATGTVAPRLAWKLGSGGAWTHENFDGTLANQIAATMLEIGAWQGGDFFPGHMGVVTWWEGAMSDANKEALDNNWRTSDLWNSAHGQPAFLTQLNTSTPTDLAGNASDLAVNGTTLDAGETLDSWNFDGTGAAVPTAKKLATLGVG